MTITMWKFNEDAAAISRSIDARQEELKAAYSRIDALTKTLKHAQEAIFWHDGEAFEMDGKTIGEAIADVLS